MTPFLRSLHCVHRKELHGWHCRFAPRRSHLASLARWGFVHPAQIGAIMPELFELSTRVRILLCSWARWHCARLEQAFCTFSEHRHPMVGGDGRTQTRDERQSRTNPHGNQEIFSWAKRSCSAVFSALYRN